MASRSRPEKQGLAVTPFTTAQAWEKWLAAHHLTSKGLWLKIAKKDASASRP